MSMNLETEFTAKLWKANASASWYFVSLPVETSTWIKSYQTRRTGFGSVRVEVEVGSCKWKTSVFPDSKLGTYVLPVKKQVRQAEGLEDGDEVTVQLGFQPD